MGQNDGMSVTVITSTIGRPELRQCIESVRAQTIPARHYVYVNGPNYHEAARQTLNDFPGVHAIYLPEETGAYGEGGTGGMADVFAAAPYLTRSDWICYLDDDNFFEPDHLESCLSLVKEHELTWAYALRRIVDREGKAICDDDWCSLGHWPVWGVPGEHLVDNSCYFVSRRLAQRVSLAWTALPSIADRCFYRALVEAEPRHGCNGRSTVNYRVGTGTALGDPAPYLAIADFHRATHPAEFPWRHPQVVVGI